VLGASRSATHAFVETEIDATTGALFARNPANSCLVRVSLLPTCEASKPTGPATAASSLGATARCQSGRARGRVAVVNKAGRRWTLARRCAPAGVATRGVVEVVFFLGEAATREDARAAILFFRAADLDALEADIARSWDETLSVIESDA